MKLQSGGKGERCVELTTGLRRLFRSRQNHSGRALTKFHIVLVAGLRARPGREKALQKLLEQMLEPTRDEPGCLTYDLHQSVVDPELFFVYAGLAGRGMRRETLADETLTGFQFAHPSFWKGLCC